MENLSLEDDEALWSRAVNVTESLFPPKLPGAPGQEGYMDKEASQTRPFIVAVSTQLPSVSGQE